MIVEETVRRYEPGFRAREVQQIAGWIRAGVSGSVVGLPGAGKSNLFSFMSQYPQWVRAHVGRSFQHQIVIIAADLNNLADGRLATLYRLILRAFYEGRMQFSPELAQRFTDLFTDMKGVSDSFVLQSALRDVLQNGCSHALRIVLLLDRFDAFCAMADPAMTNTLRGLRDSFKQTLCYIVGMQQAIAYLPNPTALGELYHLLDLHTLWLGPMTRTDSTYMIAQEAVRFGHTPPDRGVIDSLCRITGRFPALLKAACHWWVTQEMLPSRSEWTAVLSALPSTQFRLRELWVGLDQEEQAALSAVANGRAADEAVLCRLLQKGLICRAAAGLQIRGELLHRYVQRADPPGRGRLCLDEETNNIFQGGKLLRDLSPLAQSVLRFLLRYPHIRHTKTEIIEHAWPDDQLRQGITDDSLYRVVADLRKVIEPDAGKPIYLVTWRGQPEGGYQLFPEGRPG